jgi:hypothetical protein
VRKPVGPYKIRALYAAKIPIKPNKVLKGLKISHFIRKYPVPKKIKFPNQGRSKRAETIAKIEPMYALEWTKVKYKKFALKFSETPASIISGANI